MSAPQGSAPRPRPEVKATSKGWTPCLLIGVALGCFAVIPFTGIVAAIVIPNFLDALDKGRAKRVEADLRNLGNRLEGYRYEQGTYPPATTMAGLVSALAEESDRIEVPLDPWRNAFRYSCWSDTADVACDTFRLVSSGKDGLFEYDDLRQYQPTEEPEGDDYVLGPEGYLQRPSTSRSSGP